MPILDSLDLNKLSKLRLNVRHVVEGLLSGLHSSPYKGQSLEFAQHREYSPGDEIRHVDWKVFGRSDRFFIKQYQDETNLRAYILLDSSGSMKYSSKGQPSKLNYAAHIAGAIAYLLLKQEDAVSLGAFDDSLRFYLPPNHQTSHLQEIFRKLEGVEAGGETGIGKVLKGFGRHIRRRGLIILVSDLLAEPRKVIETLKYFRCRHHEILVIQVLDPEEVKFRFSGENTFVQLEGNAEISADSDTVRDEYRQLMKNFIDEYKHSFRRSRIEYAMATTDMPLEKTIYNALMYGNK
ncbi:MAG: DUF58 domain-containing protein [Elusimicrobiota bacterium]